MKRTPEELLAALDALGDDVLDPNYPVELVDEELRETGCDPREVGEWGAAHIELLKRAKAAEAKLTRLTARLGPCEACDATGESTENCYGSSGDVVRIPDIERGLAEPTARELSDWPGT